LRNVLYAEDATNILWLAAAQPKLAGQMCFAASNQHLSVADIARFHCRTFQAALSRPWNGQTSDGA